MPSAMSTMGENRVFPCMRAPDSNRDEAPDPDCESQPAVVGLPAARERARLALAHRAVALSALAVALLAAMEYGAFTWLRRDLLKNPLGSQITEFAVSNNGEIGAFVLADNGDLADRKLHRGQVSFVRRYRLGFLDLHGGKLQGELLTLPSAPMSVLPSDGHSEFLIGCRDGSIVRFACRSEASQPTRFAKQADYMVTNLLHARESKAIIVRGESIFAWHADTGELSWQRRFKGHRALAIDDCGRWLFCGLGSGDILQVDATTGRVERVCSQRGGEVAQIAVSPCCEYLACVLIDGRLALTRLPDGKDIWTGRASGSAAPAFSADGRLLIINDFAASGRLRVISASSGAPLFELGKHEGIVAGIRCAADGTVYSWGADGCITAWALDRRQQVWMSHPANEQGRRRPLLAATRRLAP